MKYYAMIGNVGYMAIEAKSDDEARAWFAVQMHHRGDGLYARWRDSGMHVSEFRRQTPEMEFGRAPCLRMAF